MKKIKLSWHYALLYFTISIFLHSPSLFGQALVKITPSDTTINSTQEVTIQVVVENINNLFAFAADINYISGILKPVSVTKGKMLSLDGKQNTLFQYSIDQKKGKIIIGLSRQYFYNAGINITKPEVAVTIKFKSISPGNSPVTLTNVGLLAPDGKTRYKTSTANGRVMVKALNEKHIPVFFSPTVHETIMPRTFNIAVKIGAVNNLYAFATDINYNPQILELLQVTEGKFLNEGDSVPTIFMKKIDNKKGKCIIGITRNTSPPSGVSSDKDTTVVWLKFKTVAPGTTLLRFSNTGLIAPNGVTHYQVDTKKGKVVTVLNDNHAFIWFNPDRLSVHIGQEKQCKIMLDNVSNAYGFAAELHYNPELLKITSLTEGRFFNREGKDQTSFIYHIDTTLGKVTIGITRLGVTTGVSVTAGDVVCIVHFQGKKAGNNSLFLRNIGIVAPDGITQYPYSSKTLSISIIHKKEGTITGTIRDSKTGQPIEGVTVFATGSLYATNKTNIRGEYTIPYVPFGLGYHVYAYKSGYANKEIIRVDVKKDNPVVKLNFTMDSVPAIFNIGTLSPNPNPDTSVIMQGGTLHRYYFISNKITGKPAGGVEIKIRSKNHSYTFFSGDDGIVNIAIRSSDIGNGYAGPFENYRIVSVNDDTLNNTITFPCKVTKMIYESFVDNYVYSKGDLNIVGVGGSGRYGRGVTLKFIGTQPDNLEKDTMEIIRHNTSGIGKDGGLNAGFWLGVDKVYARAEIGAKIGAGSLFLFKDSYKFSGNTLRKLQPITLFLLMVPGNALPLDNTFIRFLSVLRNNYYKYRNDISVVKQAYIENSKGIKLEAGGSAKLDIGLNIDYHNKLDLETETNIGASFNVFTNCVYHNKDHVIENNIGCGYSYNYSLINSPFNILRKIPYINFDDENNIHNSSDTYFSSIKYGVFYDTSNSKISKYQVTLRNIVEYKNSGAPSVNIENKTTYSITDKNVLKTIHVKSLPVGFHNLQVKIKLSNNSFSQIAASIFHPIISYNKNRSNQSEAIVSYTKRKTNFIKKETSPQGAGIRITKFLTASLASFKGFTTGKSKITEKGVWVSGKLYKLEEYSPGIQPIPFDYYNYIQKVVDGIPLSLKMEVGLLNVYFPKHYKSSNEIFPIGDIGSYLSLPSSSIPENIDSIYCTSWSWYGDAPSVTASSLSPNSLKSANIIKQSAEKAFGMKYGVGGFYQIEPYNTKLLDTAYITLYYPDSDIAGMKGSLLRIYREDKVHHKWVCVGGEDHPDSNFVRAPITRFGLYTIAPSMPNGNIRFSRRVDSTLITDSTVVSIISDTIYNNDSTIVSNNELFTIKLNSGTIINTDMDTILPGVQIKAKGGILAFKIKPDSISLLVNISVNSVWGNAYGSTYQIFYKKKKPPAPSLIKYDADNQTVHLTWNKLHSPDIAGYIVYFDFDTIAPYKGYGIITGDTSPIRLGVDTSFTVSGLLNDSTYYFWVSSFDIYGNESNLSNRFKVTVIPKPVINDTSVCSCNDSIVLKAKGQNITWFPDSLLSDTLATGDSLIVHLDTAKIYRYWLTQRVNGNTSSAKKVTIYVHSTYNLRIDTTICSGTKYFANGNWQTKTGIYYDSLVSHFGCDSIVTTYLTVDSLPVISLGNDTTICKGNKMELNPGTFTNFLWNTGSENQTLIVDSAGTYFVTVTDSIGCQTTSKKIIISYYPDPEKPGLPKGDTSVNLINKQVSVYSSSSNSTNLHFVWSVKPKVSYVKSESNNNSFTVYWNKNFTGRALINVGVFYQCDTIFSDTLKVRLYNPTGIQNQEIKKSIHVYPNPAKTKLFIGFKDITLKNISILVYNEYGQLLLKKYFDNTPQQAIKINLQNYCNGLYYIRFKTDKGNVSKKFIVEKH